MERATENSDPAGTVRAILHRVPIAFDQLDDELVKLIATFQNGVSDLDAAQIGDVIAEVLYTTPLVQLEIRRLLFHEDDIADVVQEVIGAVVLALPTFRAESRFRTWVRQIAHNKAVDHLRKRERWERATPADRASTASDAYSISSQLASRCDLAAAVEQLPDHYRQVVFRRDIQAMSYAEIAHDLDLETNTVRSRLARGRARLAASVTNP